MSENSLAYYQGQKQHLKVGQLWTTITEKIRLLDIQRLHRWICIVTIIKRWLP